MQVSEVGAYISSGLINYLSMDTEFMHVIIIYSPPHHGGHFPLPQAIILISLRVVGFCRPQIALQAQRIVFEFHAHTRDHGAYDVSASATV